MKQLEYINEVTVDRGLNLRRVIRSIYHQLQGRNEVNAIPCRKRGVGTGISIYVFRFRTKNRVRSATQSVQDLKPFIIHINVRCRSLRSDRD